ncbi:TIGR02391 family protein [Kribbella sp. HUAS MG21]|uniref:TIGR02391 family protein n=1 Tax=Kribbella sp. HUAS MG21 TaxID=3160966 RepID=A0AAU7TDC1_9ACTN
MDGEWMQEQLTRYLYLADTYDAELRDAAYESVSSEAQRLNDEATMLLPTIERILTALDVMPETGLLPPAYRGSNETPRWIKQGLGILRDRDEWSARLAPQAPILAAEGFHPLVWEAAAPLWDADPVAAVETAAKWLTASIQQKAGSKLPDRELVIDVFSPKPNKGRTRLWFPGDPEDRTWKSRQEGLHYLSTGAYSGIRNIAAHSHDPGWSEHEALEYLAVLSTVARWSDETTVVNPS